MANHWRFCKSVRVLWGFQVSGNGQEWQCHSLPFLAIFCRFLPFSVRFGQWLALLAISCRFFFLLSRPRMATQKCPVVFLVVYLSCAKCLGGGGGVIVQTKRTFLRLLGWTDVHEKTPVCSQVKGLAATRVKFSKLCERRRSPNFAWNLRTWGMQCECTSRQDLETFTTPVQRSGCNQGLGRQEQQALERRLASKAQSGVE